MQQNDAVDWKKIVSSWIQVKQCWNTKNIACTTGIVLKLAEYQLKQQFRQPKQQFKQLKQQFNNSESWIGITDEILDKLQDFQNSFMLSFFEAPKQGTPTGIGDVDANILPMKNIIMLNKLT